MNAMTPPTQHTAEPWKVRTLEPQSKLHFIWSPSTTALDVLIARTCFAPDSEANAARIVACVNACAGISDPAETLKAVREALEKISHIDDLVYSGHDTPESRLETICKLADAALALLPPTQDAKV